MPTGIELLAKGLTAYMQGRAAGEKQNEERQREAEKMAFELVKFQTEEQRARETAKAAADARKQAQANWDAQQTQEQSQFNIKRQDVLDKETRDRTVADQELNQTLGVVGIPTSAPAFPHPPIMPPRGLVPGLFPPGQPPAGMAPAPQQVPPSLQELLPAWANNLAPQMPMTKEERLAFGFSRNLIKQTDTGRYVGVMPQQLAEQDLDRRLKTAQVTGSELTNRYKQEDRPSDVATRDAEVQLRAADALAAQLKALAASEEREAYPPSEQAFYKLSRDIASLGLDELALTAAAQAIGDKDIARLKAIVELRRAELQYTFEQKTGTRMGTAPSPMEQLRASYARQRGFQMPTMPTSAGKAGTGALPTPAGGTITANAAASLAGSVVKSVAQFDPYTQNMSMAGLLQEINLAKLRLPGGELPAIYIPQMAQALQTAVASMKKADPNADTSTAEMLAQAYQQKNQQADRLWGGGPFQAAPGGGLPETYAALQQATADLLGGAGVASPQAAGSLEKRRDSIAAKQPGLNTGPFGNRLMTDPTLRVIAGKCSATVNDMFPGLGIREARLAHKPLLEYGFGPAGDDWLVDDVVVFNKYGTKGAGAKFGHMGFFAYRNGTPGYVSNLNGRRTFVPFESLPEWVRAEGNMFGYRLGAKAPRSSDTGQPPNPAKRYMRQDTTALFGAGDTRKGITLPAGTPFFPNMQMVEGGWISGTVPGYGAAWVKRDALKGP